MPSVLSVRRLATYHLNVQTIHGASILMVVAVKYVAVLNITRKIVQSYIRNKVCALCLTVPNMVKLWYFQFVFQSLLTSFAISPYSVLFMIYVVLILGIDDIQLERVTGKYSADEEKSLLKKSYAKVKKKGPKIVKF